MVSPSTLPHLSATLMLMTRIELNEAVLDGGRAWWYRTTILGQRDSHAKPCAATVDVLVQHRGHGADAEQPAWHCLAAV